MMAIVLVCAKKHTDSLISLALCMQAGGAADIPFLKLLFDTHW
jgi:hypothetical protein